MARTCEDHPFEVAGGTCASCARDFCATCLVYPQGEEAEPLCIPCGLAASGVRRWAARPRVRSLREAIPPPAAPRGSPAGRAALGVALATGTGAVAASIVTALT